MKNITVLHLLLWPVIFPVCLAQVPNLDGLKKAQDRRKEMFEQMRQQRVADPVNFVNPFVGTGGHGHTFPGATAPFGMVQLSPDTRYEGWDGCGGYHYSDSVIYGFSHTHLSGTGIPDYADLLITPQVGTPKWQGKYEVVDGYGHYFDHQNETAAPGYYHVFLPEANVQVDLVSHTRSGMHRYDFGTERRKKFILLDLDYRDKVLAADFKVLSNQTISGFRRSKDWAEDQSFYFFLQSQIPWTKATRYEVAGKHKLLLEFAEDVSIVQLQVGISAVDENGAELNLLSDRWTWNHILEKKRVADEWKNELNKIKFHTSDPIVKTIFYTALYHTFIAPNVFSDSDGRYRGMDGKIHQIDPNNDAQYTVFSLWDTFRAAHPLFTLVQPERTKHFVQTFNRQNQQMGDLPVWELSANETECMIGYHSVSVIADAYLKGLIPENQAPMLLDAMVKTARAKDYSKSFFHDHGYLNLAEEPESVSKALEYAYDDFCIAQMARKMGKNTLADSFEVYAFQFINHFDPQSKFFRARRGAQWFAPFDPREVNFNYTEANAWQYSAFAPHAVGNLIQLHGGKKNFSAHLDSLFNTNPRTTGRDQADITGLIGQYAHGNEPSHHMAYLYNYTHESPKTQLFIDSIQRNLYTHLPDGLSGNEDCGQMSAWYVLSALGIYQIAPGRLVYDVGRPLFDSVEIQLGNNKTLRMIALNNGKGQKFIQKIEVDGREVNTSYFTHQQLVEATEIVWTMGSQPSSNFANLRSAPSLEKVPQGFIPLPHFVNTERVFDRQINLKLALPYADPQLKIQYKLLGAQDWLDYKSPFLLENTAVFEIRTYSVPTKKSSASLVAQFKKKDDRLSMLLESAYSNQYAAGGANALIDGIEGNSEYRTGDWQGFYDQDVNVTITLKAGIQNPKVAIGLLEDVKSWIFWPTSVNVVFLNEKGEVLKVGTQVLTSDKPNDYRPASKKIIVVEGPTEGTVHAVRIQMKNSGNCPEWHLGAGNPTWIFADEIKVTQ